jgi:crotonobetainyl-CoA:carnitine CoA-transferase CaiB-like acyl-CoA transferase
VLDRLLARADVFVQNLGPGAAGRLGLTTPDLRTRHPGLVVCAVTGYGSTGPYATKKAYDMLVQAETGLTSITGTPHTPSRVGISAADIAAGMYAYSGILAALLARAESGAGAALEVSLFDALGEWMGAPMYYAAFSGVEPPRSGAAHATIAPYEPFVSGDGAEIYLAIQNGREWARFCEQILGRPELASDPRFAANAARVEHRLELHGMIENLFAELSASDILDRLERAGIACARRNSVAGFVAHPQLSERDCWRTIDSPAGPLRALRPPVRMDGVEPEMGAVPSLGQHTQRILEELGFDPEKM